VILAKFTEFYIPDCELSLEEGVICNKNSLTCKRYIRLKIINWGIKCVLAWLLNYSTPYLTVNVAANTKRDEYEYDIVLE